MKKNSYFGTTEDGYSKDSEAIESDSPPPPLNFWS